RPVCPRDRQHYRRCPLLTRPSRTSCSRWCSRGYRGAMSDHPRRRAAFTAILRAFKPGTPGFGRRVAALPRLLKASLRREYDGGARLLLMAAASLYIVSPVDLLPEAFLFVFGLID